jgi:predicted neuraminidase
MPVTWARDGAKEWFAGASQVHGCAMSRDEGATWSLHGEVHTPPWGLENMFIERKDGVVVMYMRCDAGTIWRSMSTDRGRTWSQGSPTTIINPGTQFFVCKLASRRWLLINSPDPTARTGIVAMLSEDEGKTWGPPLMLDERTDVSYPDACQAADGTIYAVHDRERHGAMEILLSVFNEGDLG